MFQTAHREPHRGHPLRLLLCSPKRLGLYLRCAGIGAPIWVVIGLFMILTPELSRALHLTQAATSGTAIVSFNIGLAIGDLASSALSQRLRSRRRVMASFLIVLAVGTTLHLRLHGAPRTWFYISCLGLGLASGYWALFVAMTTELFGTNLRATVATTAPNLVRAFVIPFSWCLAALQPKLGLLNALTTVTVTAVAVALLCLASLPETFGRNLDFLD